MTSEKIVVALLLITIILSIVSVIVTFSLNASERPLKIDKNPAQSDPYDNANVQLEILPSGGTE